MRVLFDVSMLLALFDRQHFRHAAAITWWAENLAHGWASCSLTQIGFLRIASQPSYTSPCPLPQAAATLQAQIAKGDHVFWPDDVSILDAGLIDRTRLLGPRQITDVYLLALAVKHSGRLVMLDAGISVAAVRGARKEQLVVV